MWSGIYGSIRSNSSGDTAEGSLYLMLFGLGTVPLMTCAIYFSGILTGLARKRIQRFIPTFVVVIGLLFILRGLGLGIPYVSPTPVNDSIGLKEVTSPEFQPSADCH